MCFFVKKVQRGKGYKKVKIFNLSNYLNGNNFHVQLVFVFCVY